MEFSGYADGGKTVAAITECTAQLARLEQDIGLGRRRPPLQPARSTGTQQKLTASPQPKPAGNVGNMRGRPHLKRPRQAHISDSHSEIIYTVSPWPVVLTNDMTAKI